MVLAGFWHAIRWTSSCPVLLKTSNSLLYSLRCFLILDHTVFPFNVNYVILKREWKGQYFSLICVILFVLLPQYAVHIDFLFFPLYSINKIKVFLMQSWTFSWSLLCSLLVVTHFMSYSFSFYPYKPWFNLTYS